MTANIMADETIFEEKSSRETGLGSHPKEGVPFKPLVLLSLLPLASCCLLRRVE